LQVIVIDLGDTMKLALLIVAFAALQTAPPQPAPLTAAQCKCSIEVTIKRADNGEPINDVDVTLTISNANLNSALNAAVAAGDQTQALALVRAQLNTPPESRSAVTDSSGNATFRDLAEGTYNIRAGRDGYLGSPANGFVNNQATSSIRVGPSNGNTAANPNSPQPNPHVTLTMIRGATISGKLLDANRRPASGVSVAAYRMAYRNGMKTINQTGNAVQTDDRGEFRLYWFPAGEYLVRTTTALRPALQNQDYPTSTYYPGTLDPSRAVAVVLKEGQELSGADFTLQTAAGVTVSGTIVNNMPGRVGPRGQVIRTVASMFLVPRNSTFFETPQLLPNVRTAVAARGAAPDDTNTPFEIRGVPPGTYDFYPVYNGDPASATTYVTGRTTIEVGSDNITNVVSVIRPGVSLNGKLSIVGTPPPSARPQAFTPANIRVNIQALDNLPSLVQAGLRTGQIAPSVADGTFTIPGFIDARYFVLSVTGLPQDAYVSEMRLGSQSFYNEGSFEIGKTTPDAMEIVVSRGGGVIQGLVQDPQHKTMVSARIALVPEAPRRQNLLLYKNATTLGGTGSFTFNGVAPGAYKLFAFESIPQGAEQNEEFMRPFESRGVNVTVSAGITTGNVVVPIIPDTH